MFEALSSLVRGATETPFPYTVGDVVHTEPDGVWVQHSGTAKADGSAVSIFVLTLAESTESKMAAARNAIKRLKTLRHPGVLRFIAAHEGKQHIYLVTEAVQPLAVVLEAEKNEMAISWGLHQIAKVLGFLAERSVLHWNICLASVFVDKAGEWKLGGLEALRNSKEDAVPWSTPERYLPPEKDQVDDKYPWARDVWGLGCLVWEVYNGTLPKPEKLKVVSSLPKVLVPLYVSLVGANVKTRPPPNDFISSARAPGQFMDNEFIRCTLFLDELTLKDNEATVAFFQKLPTVLDSFPRNYCQHRILPQLLEAFQYGKAGSVILAPLFKIGKLLSAQEYQTQIVPIVVKLFSSPDRATRMNLLKQLEHFVEYLSPQVITNDIFPHVANGFTDTVPQLREQTVISMQFLVPKLSEVVVDGQVIKFFAKLQVDEVPSIRTNTTICLGKVAPNLPSSVRARVLIPAFVRATKDSFMHARIAGIKSLLATLQYHTAPDCAHKLFPSIAPLALDPEKAVRDQAFVLIRALTARLEQFSEGTQLPEEEKTTEQTQFTKQLFDWSSSFFNKLGKQEHKKGGDAQSAGSGQGNAENVGENNLKHGGSPPKPNQRADDEEEEGEEEEDEEEAWEDAETFHHSTITPSKPVSQGWNEGESWEDADVDFDDFEEKASNTTSKPAASLVSKSLKPSKPLSLTSTTNKQPSKPVGNDGWGDSWGGDDGPDDDDDEAYEPLETTSNTSSKPSTSKPASTQGSLKLGTVSNATKPSQPPASNGGWGKKDDGWGEEEDWETPSPQKNGQADSKDLARQKREERKAMQSKAVEEKKMLKLAPSKGLGAVRKKD